MNVNEFKYINLQGSNLIKKVLIDTINLGLNSCRGAFLLPLSKKYVNRSENSFNASNGTRTHFI